MKITKSQLKKIIKEELEGQLPLPGMADAVGVKDANVAMDALFQYIDNLMDQNPDANPEDFYKNMYFYKRIFAPTVEASIYDLFGSFASKQSVQHIEETLASLIEDFVALDSEQRKDFIRTRAGQSA